VARYKRYTGDTTQTYQKLYGYKNLLAWQAADELSAFVHKIVVQFGPRYFKLANQMLGSASSVKANIAEGYCRNSLGDYIRFCEIGRGSLGELGSQIQDCERWEVVQGDELNQLIHYFSDASYLLEQLIKGLRAKRKDGTWDRSMGVKEQSTSYVTDDSDLPFIAPDEPPDLGNSLRASENSENI
jgi:four helix bundle protein